MAALGSVFGHPLRLLGQHPAVEVGDQPVGLISRQVRVVVVPVGEQIGAIRIVGRDRLEGVGEWVEGGFRIHEDVVERLVVDDLAGPPEPPVPEDVVDVMMREDRGA